MPTMAIPFIRRASPLAISPGLSYKGTPGLRVAEKVSSFPTLRQGTWLLGGPVDCGCPSYLRNICYVHMASPRSLHTVSPHSSSVSIMLSDREAGAQRGRAIATLVIVTLTSIRWSSTHRLRGTVLATSHSFFCWSPPHLPKTV